MKLSKDTRENSAFSASTSGSEEANYFTGLAQQHKNAKDQALKSYESAMNSLDRVNEELSLFEMLAPNPFTQKLKAEKELYQQKANEAKAKAANEEILFQYNQFLAQSASGKKPEGNKEAAPNLAEETHKAEEKEVKKEKIQKEKRVKKVQHNKEEVSAAEAYSQNAVTAFTALVEDKKLTAADINELYLRCSREIAIKAPNAWAALDKAYSNALGKAHTPNNTMDAQSKNAISGFKGSVNSSMTADEMNETFLRFIRDVSVKYPEAWKEMESILTNYMANARKEETSMDDQSKNAIVNFKQTINASMTKDEMVETFIRFSREVSVKYPDAWKELESVLTNQVGNAYQPNTLSDSASEQAVDEFKNALTNDLTKDDLVEMFLRFSREISVNYSEKRKELVDVLNNSLTYAYNPDTTIDKHSEELVNSFATLVETQTFDKEGFENTFANYFKQIGLNLSKARKMMTDIKSAKLSESEDATQSRFSEVVDSNKIGKEFEKLTLEANQINEKVQNKASDLQNIYNEDDQTYKRDEITKLMGEKYQKDATYHSLMANINSNSTASSNVKDDYLFNMTADIVPPDKKAILERGSQGLTEWDMMRTMRRDEMKNLMYQLPQEELTEILYAVPKTTLLNGLEMLPQDQQLDVLTNSRYADALMREMPRKQLVEMLPDAYEMLPILMMLGKTENGFKNGAELIEDTVINGKKVNTPQNETRQQEELLPFVMEQMLNKTPRLADARVQVSPLKAAMKKEMAADKKNVNNPKLTTKMEELAPNQLKELAQESINGMNDKEQNQATSAQRGGPEEFMNFLQDLKKVDSVDAGKMAMSNLFNSQAQSLKNSVIPALSDRELLKINKNFGKDSNDMIKEMPNYVVTKQLHDLSKTQLVDGYKKVGKDMIMNRIQDLPSQVIARVATEVLDRDTIYSNYMNGQGVAA